MSKNTVKLQPSESLCPICKKSFDRCKCEFDIEVKTPEQAKWQEVLDAQKNNLVSAKVIAEQAEVLIALCEKKIAEQKFK